MDEDNDAIYGSDAGADAGDKDDEAPEEELGDAEDFAENADFDEDVLLAEPDFFIDADELPDGVLVDDISRYKELEE